MNPPPPEPRPEARVPPRPDPEHPPRAPDFVIAYVAPSPRPGPPAPLDDEILIGHRPGDRWAHRRGEPRVFAFGWTMFLMAATMLAFIAVGMRGSVTLDVYRPVARTLLVTVVAGVTVLWPMARLCQARPVRGGPSAALTDWFVVVLPVQAIIWPQALMTWWPLITLAGVSALVASWGALVMGILAWALGPGVRVERLTGRVVRPGPGVPAAWMALIMAILAGGPAVMAARGERPGHPGGEEIALASPFTGVMELTRDRPWPGFGSTVTPRQWRIIAGPAAAGVALWAAAFVFGLARGRVERRHLSAGAGGFDG